MRPAAGAPPVWFGPGAHVLERDERHRRHAVRPMTVLTAPLQNGGDILGEGDFTRRSGWFGPERARRNETDGGWDDQRYPHGSPAVIRSNLHRTHSLKDTRPIEQGSPVERI